MTYHTPKTILHFHLFSLLLLITMVLAACAFNRSSQVTRTIASENDPTLIPASPIPPASIEPTVVSAASPTMNFATLQDSQTNDNVTPIPEISATEPITETQLTENNSDITEGTPEGISVGSTKVKFSLETANHTVPDDIIYEVGYYNQGGGGGDGSPCIEGSQRIYADMRPRSGYLFLPLELESNRQTVIETGYDISLTTCDWLTDENVVVNLTFPDDRVISTTLSYSGDDYWVTDLAPQMWLRISYYPNNFQIFFTFYPTLKDAFGKYELRLTGSSQTLEYIFWLDEAPGPRIYYNQYEEKLLTLHNFAPNEGVQIFSYHACNLGNIYILSACFTAWQGFETDVSGSLIISLDYEAWASSIVIVGEASGTFSLDDSVTITAPIHSVLYKNGNTISASDVVSVDTLRLPDLVYIPQGEFLMGAQLDYPDYGSTEIPAHLVNISGYWIQTEEVSNVDYQTCVSEGACKPPRSNSSETRANYYNNPVYAEYPVIYVNYDQAYSYCAWIGGRLPTEAEWEKAGRNPANHFYYPWGVSYNDDLIEVGGRGIIGDTIPVNFNFDGGTPWGLLNMAGNVWEWTSDWFDPNYYAISPYHDPTGPDTGDQKVIRGGSWILPNHYVSLISRFPVDPNQGYYNVGVRCVVQKSFW